MDFNQAAQKLGLGGPQINPYGVGGPQINPYGANRGLRVGAPAMEMQSNPQQPVTFQPQGYVAGGNNYMGLGQTIIPANTLSVPLNRKPIRSFQAIEMRFPSTVVGLMIDQFAIQGVQFFANAPGQGVPIELWSEVSRMLGFNAVTIQPETGCDFTISNPTGAPLVFQGCLWGTQLMIG